MRVRRASRETSGASVAAFSTSPPPQSERKVPKAQAAVRLRRGRRLGKFKGCARRRGKILGGLALLPAHAGAADLFAA